MKGNYEQVKSIFIHQMRVNLNWTPQLTNWLKYDKPNE